MMNWFIDEYLYFRRHLWISGWILDTGIEQFELRMPNCEPVQLPIPNLPSPDLVDAYGPVAHSSRFSASCVVPSSEAALAGRLFVRQHGRWIELEDFRTRTLMAGTTSQLSRRFFQMISSGRVLEIGS